MSFDQLNDDNVKLVAYTIVSIRRDNERVMPEGQDQIVITDNMTSDDFVAWIIARYIQKRIAEIFVKKSERERQALKQELDAEQKYLRVHFVVSRRWEREPLKFEERQIEELKEISRALTN